MLALSVLAFSLVAPTAVMAAERSCVEATLTLNDQHSTTLHIPTDYIALTQDLSDGKRGAVTLDIWLADMGPARPHKKKIYSETPGTHFTKLAAVSKVGNAAGASMMLTYNQRENLVPAFWANRLKLEGITNLGFDGTTRMETFRRVPPRSQSDVDASTFYWGKDIPAFAECLAVSKRCTVTTHLSRGVYGKVVYAEEYMSDIRRLREQLTALVDSFRQKCPASEPQQGAPSDVPRPAGSGRA